jgi:hypothetical protein
MTYRREKRDNFRGEQFWSLDTLTAFLADVLDSDMLAVQETG